MRPAGCATLSTVLAVDASATFTLSDTDDAATVSKSMAFDVAEHEGRVYSGIAPGGSIVAAGVLDLFEHRDLLGAGDIGVFATGFLAAFVSAFVAVRALLRYISRNDFTVFAWYRIAFGLIVLVTGYMGLVDWTTH